ncbi:MAG TPA: hypothetical protein VFQ69_03525 [Rhizomicrobium sp.]|jgi:hypothetical protein|nr:hypothetical protein [Rhizomicrobium sp.]
MIIRAAFWIGLVSLLAPHEPDLGLGRPGAGIAQISPAAFLSAATGLSRMDGDCGSACAGASGGTPVSAPDRAAPGTSSVMAGLADVRAQIAADRRARAAREKAGAL